MIYLTGDTHGRFDRIFTFCEERNTSRDDILIILGDAGINYHLGSRADRLKDSLKSLPITLLCIHGNHEQRPFSIDSYREIDWHGGKVYVEPQYPFLLFAKDGDDLDGKKAVAIGGAYSVDKYYRLARGWAWFPNEQPSADIKVYVEQQLAKHGNQIDIVLSHTCPLKYEPTEVFLSGIDQSSVDKNTEEWLDRIEKRIDYKRWYCGHYHTEKEIDKMQFMFQNIGILQTE